MCGASELAWCEEPAGYLLGFPPGARAIAMGMAQGVVAEDADAGYWNPAALAFIEPNHAGSFTYSSLNRDFNINYPFVFAAYSERVEGLHGTVAVSFEYFDFGRIEPNFPGEESFRPYELSPGVAYGGRVSDALAVGVGFKIYRINYSRPSDPPEIDYSANTVLFDAGVLWRGMDSRLLIGGSVQNLGPDLELGSEGQSYPAASNLKLATGARLVDIEAADFTVACDLDIPLAGSYSPRLMAGGEMRVGEYAAIRIGLRYFGWDLEGDSSSENLQNYDISIGFGVRVKGITFDYASAPWSVFLTKNTHYFTVGARF
jgi:hypothetical protein